MQIYLFYVINDVVVKRHEFNGSWEKPILFGVSSTMEEVASQNNKQQQEEVGEEQLAVLIKQAGDEARARKREALDRHFNMLRTVIAEGVSRRKESIPA